MRACGCSSTACWKSATSGAEERREIDGRLAGRGRGFDEALNEASALLSGLAGGAGIVASPVRDAGVKHVEFVALGSGQALAVLVADDGTVENRLMPLAAGVTPSNLQEASNFLNARLKGRLLSEARQEMGAELTAARSELDAAAARLVEDGLAAWSGGPDRERSLIVRGRANLLQDAGAAEDLERVRVLFDDLEQKEQLIGLLDGVNAAQGVRIFIGAETRSVFAFGFRRRRGALYDGPATGSGRHRRDRTRKTELRPHHPVGGLHRPGAGANPGRTRHVTDTTNDIERPGSPARRGPGQCRGGARCRSRQPRAAGRRDRRTRPVEGPRHASRSRGRQRQATQPRAR